MYLVLTKPRKFLSGKSRALRSHFLLYRPLNQNRWETVNLKLWVPVERVIDAGVRERADFIVYVRYELEQDAWELLGLEWS